MGVTVKRAPEKPLGQGMGTVGAGSGQDRHTGVHGRTTARNAGDSQSRAGL